MQILLLVTALAAGQASAEPVQSGMVQCTAARLTRFMRATGVSQPWPRAIDLPESLQNWAGTVLSGPGPVMDGYTQTLHVDQKAQSAYVVEQGGIAGIVRIFGPLPVAACPVAAP